MIKFAIFPAIAFSFTVATAQVTDLAMDSTAATDAVTEVTPQGTLDAVEAAGGLTQLDPAAAVANIDGWIAQLEGVPGSDSVSRGLQTLKEQLTAPTLDANAVGMTLTSLGEQTTGLAETGTPLGNLGDALAASGSELTGATAEQSTPASDYSAEPTDAGVSATSTLDAANSAGGLTALEPSTALSNIDGWIAKLQDVEGGEPVIEKLEELKTELTKSPVDGSKVGYALGDLSDLTETLAPDDPELQKLAEALKSSASELED